MRRYLLSPYLSRLTKKELRQITNVYNVKNPHFLAYEQIEPTSILYFLHDQAQNHYILLTTDSIDGIDVRKFPCRITFNYYQNRTVSFNAVKLLPRAPSKTGMSGCSDNQFLTYSARGDKCLLFACKDFDIDPIEAQEF